MGSLFVPYNISLSPSKETVLGGHKGEVRGGASVRTFFYDLIRITSIKGQGGGRD